MPFDALLKKYFSVVVLTLVAVMAYLQASGTMRLFGASLGADESTLTSAPKPTPNAMPSVGETVARSGEPILSRNPFDSQTGPLNASAVDSFGLPSPKADLSNPLSAPACDGIKVAIITESEDPTWSIAALQGPGEPRPAIRRGRQVGTHDVTYIGYNAIETSLSVADQRRFALSIVLFAAATPVRPPSPRRVTLPAARDQQGAHLRSRSRRSVRLSSTWIARWSTRSKTRPS